MKIILSETQIKYIITEISTSHLTDDDYIVTLMNDAAHYDNMDEIREKNPKLYMELVKYGHEIDFKLDGEEYNNYMFGGGGSYGIEPLPYNDGPKKYNEYGVDLNTVEKEDEEEKIAKREERERKKQRKVGMDKIKLKIKLKELTDKLNSLNRTIELTEKALLDPKDKYVWDYYKIYLADYKEEKEKIKKQINILELKLEN